MGKIIKYIIFLLSITLILSCSNKIDTEAKLQNSKSKIIVLDLSNTKLKNLKGI